MSNKQLIMWTALPNGLTTISGKKYLRLTVLVSPRLYSSSDTTLATFPDFLMWPQKLKTASFKLRFHNSSVTKVLAAKADPSSFAADETLWGYLFSSSTYVKHYKFQDYQNRFVISSPIAPLYNHINSQYVDVITQSMLQTDDNGNYLTPNLPTTDSFMRGGIGQNFANGFPAGEDLEDHLGQQKKLGRGKTFRAPTSPAEAFLQHALFFYRREDYHPRQPTKGGQKLDFHRMVSSLTKYPELMRRLGLAVDLIVPFDPALPTGDPSALVRLVAPFGANDLTPQSYFTLDASDFLPTSSSGDVKQGFLDLSNTTKFNLFQVDVDGAALKYIGLVRQVLSMFEGQRVGLRNQLGLPALRSGGFSVIQTGKAGDLTKIFPNAANSNTAAEGGSSTSVKLYAEDCVRGIRYDIWDSQTKAWHSLMMRAASFDPANPSSTLPGSYEFVHAPSAHKWFNPVHPDEAFVSLAATQDPSGAESGGTSPDLYLHESLMRWMGWSLAADRPGQHVGIDDKPAMTNNQPGKGVGLVTHFGVAKGSLPFLRFGVDYRIRARAADLAGNSPPLSSNLDLYEAPPKGSPPVRYRRFEPVPTPALILRDDISGSPGESTERLVIRSNYNATPTQEVTKLTSYGFPGFLNHSTRHIASPRTTQLMAEHHGMFDLSGGGLDPNAYAELSTLDGAFDSSAVESTDNLVLPYLPDVLARGASLFNLPGLTPYSVFGPPGTMPSGNLGFIGTWPYLKPFRIRVLEGTSAPAWDANARLLTVYLAKAQQQTIRLSAYLLQPDLDLMGIWGWMEEAYKAGQLDAKSYGQLQKFALNGEMWPIEPFQEITLVHAVQQPLIQPKFTNLTAYRDFVGETYAILEADPMPIDGPSTIKLDVNANWTEPRDDLTLDHCTPNSSTPPTLPTEIKGQKHVVEIPLQPTDTQVTFTLADNRRHMFGDTKYRRVSYTATGTTRFLEYFPESGVAAGTIPTTRPSPVATIDVPSTARPDAPKLLYVVPSFKWTPSQSGDITKTLRAGGYLRVYLERPWFSSGDGELLGVVLINDSGQTDTGRPGRKRGGKQSTLATGGVEEDLKGYVTQWGADPLWGAAEITDPPMTTNFPGAVATQSYLYLEELGGAEAASPIPVAVAGHPVVWDPERCLWYADVQFHWGTAYFPFVRMALARYQPHSISNPDTVHLSRVVLADFAQLAPHRLAQVQTKVSTSDPKLVKVSVMGYGYTLGPGGIAPSGIEVSVEQQMPGIPGETDGKPSELAWVPVPNANYELTADPQRGFPYEFIWSTTFDLPHAPGSVPFRLIFREYEIYPIELGVSSSLGKPGASKDASFQPKERRLVYASALQI